MAHPQTLLIDLMPLSPIGWQWNLTAAGPKKLLNSTSMLTFFFPSNWHIYIRRELLDGLRSVGFKLTDGIEGTGFGLLPWCKAGGYYLGIPFVLLNQDG